MVDVNYWTIQCKNCGINYDISKSGKIKILSLNEIKLNEELKCPSCGNSNSIATLKNSIGY